MVVPLDMALGIDNLPFKVTVNMMLDIACRAINAHSYDELQIVYKRDWDIKISDELIRKITNYLGCVVYEEDVELKQQALEHLKSMTPKQLNTVEKGPFVLYILCDGAMVNTVVQKNGTTWRENKLGGVFSSKDILVRTNKNGETNHKILKREYISYLGDASTFMEHLYTMALRHDLEGAGKVVIISDGAKWIKNFKEDYCKGLDVTHILDYTHMKENIFKFASAFIRGKKKKLVWAEQLKEHVKNGEIDEALAMAEEYKDKKKPGVPNIYTYLTNNRDCINYPAYEEAGYFIGSGFIESANRSVMQERLKLPGMRWDPKSAQYVLSLKCKYDSGLWDDFVIPLIYKHFGLI